LLFGGYETTRNLIGNAIYLLLSNRDQYQLLKHQPELVDSCINEVLRLESPVQYTGRLVRKDVSLGGVEFKVGNLVIIDISAANRDFSIYENPNSFCITRKSPPHLAFGFGGHYCLGAGLALMECRAVLNYLIKKDIRLHTISKWSNNFLYRGLDELVATVSK
jgi:cytochrome P450